MTIKKCIINANVIKEDEILEKHAVFIDDDRICRIVPMTEIARDNIDIEGMDLHDAEDAYLSPGFIDIHSDNIENVAQPRPSSIIELDIALREHEKQLVNQGITTMYHAISVMKEQQGMREKEIRSPQNMKILIELIHNIHKKKHIIRHRFHCRFDIRNIEGYETLLEYIENGYFHLLSFTDHSPGQGQFRDMERMRVKLRKNNLNMNDTEIDKILNERMSVPKLTFEMIEKAALKAHSKNIPLASHDDDSLEKINFVRDSLKADISEFPVEITFARKAKEKGMYTVAGAPNVLIGKSHSGNMSALEAIQDGCVDILCSDYYPPALLHAVFKLNSDYEIPLWQAFRMVTLNPAKALRVQNDYGSVAVGKKADLMIIKLHDGRPAITKVFIDGQMVSRLYYRN